MGFAIATGQTAREIKGCGMRLNAALPMGFASKIIKDVIANGM